MSHQSPYTTDPFWDRDDAACTVCRGRGWIEQEGPNGMPAAQVACPYCHGARNAAWVGEKRAKNIEWWDTRRTLVILAMVALFFAGKWPVWDPGYAQVSTATWPAYLFGLHIILWVALVILFIRSPKVKPSKVKQVINQHRPQHAPGFTTDGEKTALIVAASAVAVKGALDAQARRIERAIKDQGK